MPSSRAKSLRVSRPDGAAAKASSTAAALVTAGAGDDPPGLSAEREVRESAMTLLGGGWSGLNKP
ncbi:hypothetical protein BJY19_000160 [Arthrobacter cupressi]|nr:hypothetical protein [Arthrobacter cupressi]